MDNSGGGAGKISRGEYYCRCRCRRCKADEGRERLRASRGGGPYFPVQVQNENKDFLKLYICDKKVVKRLSRAKRRASVLNASSHLPLLLENTS
ncbi:hypothetical protein GCM10011378_39530 [Hymenobacter glacieicola]|uniref:Uncharacterized protein n=1 Tax=Hymenobacter glacieicola TaxID=1562124 RepID=A0ABQ1X4J4_9BACT|nr:hypothetical protein GCM10011378_39530 [Hymenobacter glacieicola]